MKPTYIQGDASISPYFNNQSRLAYGTSGLGGVWGAVQESESIEALLYALENGVSVFDTAPSYGEAENYLGKALRQWKGKKPFVSTKIGRLKGADAFDTKLDYTPDGLKRSLENSLNTLGVSKIDLLFLHEPQLVPLAQMDSVLDTLKSFKAQGLVDRLGVGGNPSATFMPYITKENFDVVSGFLKMNACNLSAFDGEIQQYQKENIAYYAASALHFSLLGNRFQKYVDEGVDGEWVTEQDLQNAIAVNQLAKELDMPLATLAQRYLFSIQEANRIVMGARTLAQIKATIQDWNQGKLPQDIFDKITHIITKK
ncbi:aryl-alcohol dehydrogenase-like predicted oxidoreductase [Wenyingzhuangia heitensis]|uniref:Aryl-alcohol dehydrogenase-like predicted oxidoreductase n=1 Tax=Wenyingzhuangia heitensis TaxID=1487859 RepID=A0ABX0U4F8_9FLAO|nr:aldo/keto reductase [Wenyingzhuangia heitensis]NIJ43747.1 aryl-alcohol dehydrogenase-like predicted oxidoreductase [Wenyingzhuangia heitensis]